MPFLSKHKIEFIDDDPFFFRRFLREVEKSNWCIKYYFDGCGTCGCFQFKKELDKYSDITILASLIQIPEYEFKTTDTRNHLISAGFIDDPGVENFERWRFHDIIGLCLDKLSKKIATKSLALLIKGTPIGDFQKQKIRNMNHIHDEWLERRKKKKKIEGKSREQKLIKQDARWAAHLKRIEKYKQRTKDMYLDRLPSRQE